MSHYFKFPLAVLRTGNRPLDCMRAAVNCAMYSAGVGQKMTKLPYFDNILQKQADSYNLDLTTVDEEEALILVGAALCNVNIVNPSKADLQQRVRQAQSFPRGVFATIDDEKFWRAYVQAQKDEGVQTPKKGGISWREFRVICGVYSIRPNSRGFAFISTEAIRARAHGCISKEEMKRRIPDVLRPPLTTKQVRRTLDLLEDLGFFARVLLSRGTRGGRMAYSIRCTDREELRQTVKDWVSYRGTSVKQNREDDREFWTKTGGSPLKNKERAKSGQSQGKAGAKSGQSQGKH